MQPFGFDFTEAATALGNHFAVRAAFILVLCLANDIVGTGEQLRGPCSHVSFRYLHATSQGSFLLSPFSLLQVWRPV